MAFSDYYRHILTYLTYFSPEIHIRSASLTVQESHNSRWVPGYAGILFRQLENGTKSWENCEVFGKSPSKKWERDTLETHPHPSPKIFWEVFHADIAWKSMWYGLEPGWGNPESQGRPPLWLTPFSEGLNNPQEMVVAWNFRTTSNPPTRYLVTPR